MLEKKELWYNKKEKFMGDKETIKNLVEIKKNIVKDFIENIKKKNPKVDNLWEHLEIYLINDGSIESVFKDIFRWCNLSFEIPEDIDKVNEVKKIVSLVRENQTTEKLSSLKSEIINISLKKNIQIYSDNLQWNINKPTNKIKETVDKIDKSTNNINKQTNNINNSTDNIKDSVDKKELENKFVKSIYERASTQIWKGYKRWWISPSTWFDCSWLWYRAFKEEWIKFSQRLTAHAFSDADVDIRKEDVKIWDFMFWDKKPSKKKHDPIYHIEMVISKPYIRNWKKYVRTLWSSTDAKDDRWNYVGKWVQIREREMKDYRHYWRPTYYYQLAQYEKSWSKNDLIAWTNRPTKDLQNKVLSS